MVASDSDSYVDGITTVYYTHTSGPGSSWILGNTLFALNTGTINKIDVEIYLKLRFNETII